MKQRNHEFANVDFLACFDVCWTFSYSDDINYSDDCVTLVDEIRNISVVVVHLYVSLENLGIFILKYCDIITVCFNKKSHPPLRNGRQTTRDGWFPRQHIRTQQERN
jgi:hypothetical protein